VRPFHWNLDDIVPSFSCKEQDLNIKACDAWPCDVALASMKADSAEEIVGDRGIEGFKSALCVVNPWHSDEPYKSVEHPAHRMPVEWLSHSFGALSFTRADGDVCAL
jgi:hypothetical protein